MYASTEEFREFAQNGVFPWRNCVHFGQFINGAFRNGRLLIGLESGSNQDGGHDKQLQFVRPKAATNKINKKR